MVTLLTSLPFKRKPLFCAVLMLILSCPRGVSAKPATDVETKSVSRGDTVSESYANEEESYYARAQLRLSAGDTIGALEDYSKLIEFRPEYPIYRMRRIDCYFPAGMFDSVIVDCSAFLESKFANDLLSRVFHQSRGIAYFRLGDYESAHDDLSSAVEGGWPVYVPAIYFRSMIDIHRGNMRKARYALIGLTEQLSNDDFDREMRDFLSGLIDSTDFLTEGKLKKESMEYLFSAIVDDLGEKLAYYLLEQRDIYLLLESTYRIDAGWKQAEKKVKKDLRRKIDNPALWYVLGRVYEAASKTQKSIKSFRKVVELTKRPGCTLVEMSIERLKVLRSEFRNGDIENLAR